MQIFGITSSKGGVGKTTLTVNLCASLASLGYKVLAIDANLTTPHLASHLGHKLAPYTLHHVLKNQIELKYAIYPSFNFYFVPGSLAVEDIVGTEPERLKESLSSIKDFDLVFVDCAPGLGKEALAGLESSENILIVTTPEYPSLLDALKTYKVASLLGKKVVGIVLNRVRKLSKAEREKIYKLLDFKVIEEIPEVKNFEKALKYNLPLVFYKPNSKASIAIKNLAFKLVGKELTSKTWVERLIEWLTK